MHSEGWAQLYPWQLDRSTGTPLFRQIYTQIRTAVLSGGLKAGAKLPSSRALASSLGIARASAVAAYEQLLAEGYIETRRGSGTFVSADVTGRTGQSRRRTGIRRSFSPQHALVEFERAQDHDEGLPFNTGRTLIDARTAEVWRKLMQYAARALGTKDLGYTDPRGLPELRQCLCDYLRATRAVRCDPEQIVVTAGTQQAMDIAIRILLAPGDEVWVEDPGYPFTYAQLLLAHVRPRPIPVDDRGIVVDAELRIAPKARGASHQFPTGVALSVARRLELLAWARESGSFLIEDDYTSEFRYSGPPLASLQGLDNDERVIYVGTPFAAAKE